MKRGNPPLTDADYAELLGFRDALRRFLHWSQREARGAGLTPAQHQLLLSVRGHAGARVASLDGEGTSADPTISDVAQHLLLRHHSAVELVDRAERAGLVRRRSDPADHRVVRIALTAEGSARLGALSTTHVDELRRLQSGLRLRLLDP